MMLFQSAVPPVPLCFEPVLMSSEGICFLRTKPHKTNVLDVETKRDRISLKVKAHVSVSKHWNRTDQL